MSSSISTKAEIVFTGLCSFLNIRNNNPDLTRPSVILVRTDLPIPKRPQDAPMPVEVHTAFIAFDSTKIRVDDATGFVRLSNADPDFWYLRLGGVLISIEDIADKLPTIDPSYDDVLLTDSYWPETTKRWNHDFVPRRGDKPRRCAVDAYLRFGGGTISAGRLSRAQWQFPSQPARHVAEEVVYRDFLPPSLDHVTIKLSDLETDRDIRTLTFKSRADRPDAGGPITIFIGNNSAPGMAEAFKRVSTNVQPTDGSHVAYLNQVADSNLRVNNPGPRPEPIPPALPTQNDQEQRGGGGTVGLCGPGGAGG